MWTKRGWIRWALAIGAFGGTIGCGTVTPDAVTSAFPDGGRDATAGTGGAGGAGATGGAGGAIACAPPRSDGSLCEHDYECASGKCTIGDGGAGRCALCVSVGCQGISSCAGQGAGTPTSVTPCDPLVCTLGYRCAICVDARLPGSGACYLADRVTACVPRCSDCYAP